MNDHDWETRFDERFTIDNGPSVERSIKDPNGMAGPIKGFIREELAKAKSGNRFCVGDLFLYLRHLFGLCNKSRMGYDCYGRNDYQECGERI